MLLLLKEGNVLRLNILRSTTGWTLVSKRGQTRSKNMLYKRWTPQAHGRLGQSDTEFSSAEPGSCFKILSTQRSEELLLKSEQTHDFKLSFMKKKVRGAYSRTLNDYQYLCQPLSPGYISPDLQLDEGSHRIRFWNGPWAEVGNPFLSLSMSEWRKRKMSGTAESQGGWME